MQKKLGLLFNLKKKKAIYSTVLSLVSVGGFSRRKVTHSRALKPRCAPHTIFISRSNFLTGKAGKETKHTSPATLLLHLNSLSMIGVALPLQWGGLQFLRRVKLL